jgi:quercetin dioxygenase-like cupin family protein
LVEKEVICILDNLTAYNMAKLDNSEVEKAKAFKNVEIIEYVSDTVVIKKIIKNPTGKISVASFDAGKELPEETIPFDTYIEIIDGNAEIVIDGFSSSLCTGQSIIIPAHIPSTIRANERFKMISTIL